MLPVLNIFGHSVLMCGFAHDHDTDDVITCTCSSLANSSVLLFRACQLSMPMTTGCCDLRVCNINLYIHVGTNYKLVIPVCPHLLYVLERRLGLPSSILVVQHKS